MESHDDYHILVDLNGVRSYMPVLNYSTSTPDAMIVYDFFKVIALRKANGDYFCNIHPKERLVRNEESLDWCLAGADTIAEVICKAALIAKMPDLYLD